ELIRRRNGLISFITHPDYLTTEAARSVYRQLLAYLAELREDERVWIATPGEVNDWWRQRAQFRIVEAGTRWRVVGAGSERARIGYAEEHMGQIALSIQGQELCSEKSPRASR